MQNQLRFSLMLTVLLSVLILPRATVLGAPPVIDGCEMFPADNPWNVDISTAAVHPNSAAYIANIMANGGDNVHPDFGENPDYGIPWITVDGATQDFVPVSFDYDEESDPGPYPIPPDAPVEGGGDRHVLVVDTSDCTLYELYAAEYQGGGDQAWTAGSGAVFDLNTNDLRPDGWTSADAAGLPILPGLARCDEVMAGEITHALRFTVSRTQAAYVYPATHYASSITDTNYPPMGLRFRLKASYNTAGLTGQAAVIAEALKTYGMILADNGSNWFISGETTLNPSSPCWNDDELNQLKAIPGTAFEVVVSPPPPSSIPGDLFRNGGFEGNDVGRVPLSWTMTNKSKDKRVCSDVNALDPGATAEVARSGYCAFKFRASSAENSILAQKIKAAAGLPAGTGFSFEGYVKAQNLVANTLRIRFKANYVGGAVENFDLFADAGTYDYTAVSQNFTVTGEIAKLRVQVRYTGQSGKVWIDDFTLVTGTSRGWMAPPGQ